MERRKFNFPLKNAVINVIIRPLSVDISHIYHFRNAISIFSILTAVKLYFTHVFGFAAVYSVYHIIPVNRFDGSKNEKNHYNITRVQAKNVVDLTHNGGVREIHCLCYIDFENRRYRPVERQQGALTTDDDSSRLPPPPQTGLKRSPPTFVNPGHAIQGATKRSQSF